MQTFKKRWRIIQDEIIHKKGSMIYLEKNIRKLMKRRYKPEQMNLESSYVYEKMQKLVEKKVYMKAWNI